MKYNALRIYKPIVTLPKTPAFFRLASSEKLYAPLMQESQHVVPNEQPEAFKQLTVYCYEQLCSVQGSAEQAPVISQKQINLTVRKRDVSLVK